VLSTALLVDCIGVFLLYIPLLPIAIVVVILLGMALTFQTGARVGGTQVLRRRRNATSDDINAPLALAERLDE
jgi:hypothetical protein